MTSRSSRQSGQRSRAKPERGLPQSRYRSTTSLTIGRKKPPSFASRLRTAKPVLPLETALILGQEPVEMMEENPVEDRPLRMPGTIHSRHGGRKASRTGPRSGSGPPLPGTACRGRSEGRDSGPKLSTGIDAQSSETRPGWKAKEAARARKQKVIKPSKEWGEGQVSC